MRNRWPSALTSYPRWLDVHLAPARIVRAVSPRRPRRVRRRLLLGGGRLNPQHASVLVVIDDDVQEVVGPLAHVTDTHPQRNEQGLPTKLLQLVVDQDAFEMARSWNFAGPLSAHEDIARPLRQLAPRVERHAGEGDGRHPVDDR